MASAFCEPVALAVLSGNVANKALIAGVADLTMADAMRAMLDELMGKERNVPLDQRKGTDLRFNDPEVCKYALAGLCPYGLFKNTKSDLGKYEVSVAMHWAKSA